MSTRLYFVRHGESEVNVLRVISNRGFVHGLTATGQCHLVSFQVFPMLEYQEKVVRRIDSEFSSSLAEQLI
jgi:broad specificity phosphatase PhoE